MNKIESMMKLFCAGLLMTGALACDVNNEPLPQDGEDATCGKGDIHKVDGATFCVYSQAIIETGFDCPSAAPNRLQYGDYTVCGSSGMLDDGIRDEIHQQYEADKLPPRESMVCQQDSACGVGSSCSRGVCVAVVAPECMADADCQMGSQCVANMCESSSPACTTSADCPADQVCDAQSQQCVSMPAEICCNGIDDDGDGLTDSNDLDDCIQEICQPVSCQSSSDCGASEVCFSGQCQVPFDEVCDDTVDNDLDGLVDCADSDCAGEARCQGPVSCLDDSQCAVGQVCSQGQCVAETSCSSDADCGIGSTCVSGVCQSNSPACSSDADCRQDEICADGMCIVPVGLPEDCSDTIDNDGDGAIDCGDVDCLGDVACQSVSCINNGDCAAGQECESASQTCIYVMCMTDADCSVDSLCFNGTCQGNSPGCGMDADCAVGQVCSQGQCVSLMCSSDADCAVGQACVNGVCQ